MSLAGLNITLSVEAAAVVGTGRVVATVDTSPVAAGVADQEISEFKQIQITARVFRNNLITFKA